jgi:hypothetical protein
MDLLPELRLKIAEYVMTARDSIVMKWRTVLGPEGTRVRKLGSIHELTTLSRVSRQIYTETSTLVWGLDTFTLSEGCPYYGR